MISNKLKEFMLQNKDLLNADTKDGWEEIYSKLNSYYYDPFITGQFTKMLLDIKLDPAERLGYIPRDYLFESDIEEYKIPPNVDLIEAYAFKWCDHLKKIYVPDSVLFIEEKAFMYCDSLEEVSLGGRLNSLDPFIFPGCDNLYKLNYRGTKEEWSRIAKDDYWAEDSALEKIVCTDGVIEL